MWLHLQPGRDGRLTMAPRTGVLGGTFDPIHLGHLAVARQAADAFGLDRVLLLPSRTPPHRPVDPSASLFHRFAMVALAAAADDRLVASDLELGRPGPSYTADTLRALGATGLGAWQIFFLIGADAFAEIATWREYPAVLDLAHFVVCSRPGAAATSLPARLPDLATRMIHVPVPGADAPQARGPRTSEPSHRRRSRREQPGNTRLPARLRDSRHLVHQHPRTRACRAASRGPGAARSRRLHPPPRFVRRRSRRRARRQARGRQFA